MDAKKGKIRKRPPEGPRYLTLTHFYLVVLPVSLSNTSSSFLSFLNVVENTSLIFGLYPCLCFGCRLLAYLNSAPILMEFAFAVAVVRGKT